MKIELKKDIEVSSKVVGNYWLRCINLEGGYSNELFTKEIVLELMDIAKKEGGHQELLTWFKHNRLAIFNSSISDTDPNGLINDLIDILKDFDV